MMPVEKNLWVGASQQMGQQLNLVDIHPQHDQENARASAVSPIC